MVRANGRPVIETKDLSRAFKDVVAVDNITLQIQAGEIFGLIGPDGAGKTTMLRLLTAIMNPTSGRATVAGFDTVSQSEAIKHRIGYMAQRFNLYGDLSVWENLNFYADVFEVMGQVRQERIDRLLAFARLTEFRDRRAAHLSGGMQKKLALACTLVHTPEIIFLDEPTTGVDPVSRREFWGILSELHLDGVTLIVTTPYMDEAERCSRVGLMYRGALVVCDTPDRITALTTGEVIALWPSDMQRARQLLGALAEVQEVYTFGEQLRLFVRDGPELEQAIRGALDQAGIEIRELRHARPRMEESFISLIRRRMAGEPEDRGNGGRA